MPYDEAVAQRVRQALAQHAGITERKMFGGLSFLLHGHMCCGVLADQLVLRLGGAEVQSALQQPHARAMDFTGKPLKSMVYIAPAGYASAASLRRWVARSVAFAATLPAKQ
jgi:TfoX/Sxy family transcriptional regulator of competence genes